MSNINTSMDIAIIGMAGKFPGADNVEELWNNLCQKVDVRQEFTDEELKPFIKDMTQVNKNDFIRKGYSVNDIDKFDASFFNITSKQAKILDPQHRLFLETAWHGLENAGYALSDKSQHIGVYAGVNFNNYIFNAAEHYDMRNIDAYFDVMLANDKDYLSSRVAYNFNLTGPAITIQTSCSTSLAAIATAYQALLDYQCDMAIAGGVGFNIPQERGYRYFKEGGLSKNSACHVFDKDATGVIHGNGLGVVILKRLNEALEDNDNIIAVIKGATINNDGIRKAAYFTPSVEGQMQVISETLSVADIAPEDIHYIEAHGTGTPVGDPIEIKAISEAYGLDGFKKYNKTCALGSIKSNIGHLGAAAGVAGLIKASLVLKNRKIPPMMNFSEVNPEINLENSPFYINTELKELTSTFPKVLNAAISSFGIGGTNVHLIIQSSPNLDFTKDKSPEATCYLLPLCAKSEESLEAQVTQLNEYVLNNKKLSLSDLSYTLQQRRQHFFYRRFIVATDNKDLQKQLQSKTIPKNQTLFSKDDNKINSMVFMFSGVGDQYTNMGYDLYKSQKTFRDVVDKSAEIAKKYLDGIDIRKVLYPKADDNKAKDEMLKAEVGFSILLTVEYALVKQLEYFGILPSQMIGHSLGEYCAALVSGVFTLDQALSLVSFRGKLIQSCEPGAMLVVNQDTNKLKASLPLTLSLAVVNSPELNMISGAVLEIEKFEIELKNSNISYNRLQGDRAGHSSTLDPILKTFEAFISKMDLQIPKIPFISNVTGTWISDDEAQSAKYWTDHLRHTVQFHKGLSVLINQKHTAFIEIGPGRGLTTIAKRHPESSRSLFAYASMRNNKKSINDNNVLYSLLGSLWLKQYTFNWDSLASSKDCRLLDLPAYPFEKQSHWLERSFSTKEITDSSPEKRENINTWFYTPSWVQLALNNCNDLKEESKNYIVFNNDNKLLNKIIKHLKLNNQNVITVNYAKEYKKIDLNTYLINANDMDDYNTLFEDLENHFDDSYTVIHGWMLDKMDSTLADNIDNFYKGHTQVLGYFSLTCLVRVLSKYKLISKGRLAVLSSQLYNITGEETLSPDKATLLGPCKTIPYEYPELDFVHIDFDMGLATYEASFNSIINDLTSVKLEDKYLCLAYRNDIRWKPYYNSISEDVILNENQQVIDIKKKGNYLITGAFGGIGSVASQWLVDQAKDLTLILVSRTPLPSRKEWKDYLEKDDNADICKRIKQVKLLESKGAKVVTYSLDVSNKKDMKKLQIDIRKNLGEVNGIVHAAGVVGGGLLELEETTKFHSNLDIKILGTKLLSNLFASDNLDFMLLCSSLGSLVGTLGQVENTSANAFLDSFARQYSKDLHKTKIMAINWDFWLEIGMILELAHTHKQIAGDEITIGILPDEGKKCLSILLNLLSIPNVVVSSADIVQLLKLRLKSTKKTLEMFENANITKSQNIQRANLSFEYIPPINNVEKILTQLWEYRLGIEIGTKDNFFELGGDSMLALPLMSDMRDALQVDLPIQLLFEKQDISSISNFIIKNESSLGITEEIANIYLEVQNLSKDEVNKALSENK